MSKSAEKIDVRGHKSKAPVEESLPAELVEKLRKAVQSAGRVSDRLAAELDSQFDIQNSYGVTINRLRHYLRRIPKRVQPVKHPTTPNVPPAMPVGDVEPGMLAAYRTRQASVSSILEGLFGRLADNDPTIWDRRAYQLLVGLVYERLACDTDELPTSELIALAKVLNESRKADIRAASSVKADDDSAPHPATKELPERFGELIRQIYGTTVGDTSANEPSIADQPVQQAVSA